MSTQDKTQRHENAPPGKQVVAWTKHTVNSGDGFSGLARDVRASVFSWLTVTEGTKLKRLEKEAAQTFTEGLRRVQGATQTFTEGLRRVHRVELPHDPVRQNAVMDELTKHARHLRELDCSYVGNPQGARFDDGTYERVNLNMMIEREQEARRAVESLAELMINCKELATVRVLTSAVFLVPRLPLMESLTDLQTDQLTTQSIDALAVKCPNLRELKLNHTAWVYHLSLKPILFGCPHLRSFEIRLLEPPTDDFVHFGQLAHLTRLTFYAGAMDDEQCRLLSHCLTPTIEDLKLSGLPVTTRGVAYFAYGFPSLHSFDVTFTSARAENLYEVLCDENAFRAIRNLIVSWPISTRLRELLHQNDMPHRENVINSTMTGRRASLSAP